MLNIHTFVVNMLEENCHLLWDDATREAWVIDCGAANKQEHDDIKAFITERGLNLTRHLLTHGHFDHVCGAQFLADTYGILPTLLREERTNYESAVQLMQQFLHRPNVTFPLPSVGEELTASQHLTLGEYDFEVIHTPGHTAGGACYYCATEGMLISGDTLFHHSCGRTDLPGGSEDAMRHSLRTLMQLPPETKVYCGHYQASAIGENRNYFQ